MRKTIALAGIAAAFMGVAAAPNASAATRDGLCQTGEFCLYYNSNQTGSVSDFGGSISDYGATKPSCYVFKGTGAGRGLCVKNHAASVWNRTTKPVTVYYNSGYAGAGQTIKPGTKANLNATLKNDNASHRYGSTSTPGTEAISFGLYNLSGGRITAGFDGYRNTPGRHEGIDIARGSGSPVRALIGGTVTNVVRGSSSSLSTIAVYNATFDRTIVYLHSAPIDSLRVGQSISRDQLIAHEAARGAGGAVHTHVEMRLGKRTTAAKSVGDPVLDNPNPTTFWNARGYAIR